MLKVSYDKLFLKTYFLYFISFNRFTYFLSQYTSYNLASISFNF